MFFVVIIVKIFSLCLKNFPCVTAKFPVFSLSGKSKNQIPCFPCAVATLNQYLPKDTAPRQGGGGGLQCFYANLSFNQFSLLPSGASIYLIVISFDKF